MLSTILKKGGKTHHNWLLKLPIFLIGSLFLFLNFINNFKLVKLSSDFMVVMLLFGLLLAFFLIFQPDIPFNMYIKLFIFFIFSLIYGRQLFLFNYLIVCLNLQNAHCLYHIGIFLLNWDVNI